MALDFAGGMNRDVFNSGSRNIIRLFEIILLSKLKTDLPRNTYKFLCTIFIKWLYTYLLITYLITQLDFLVSATVQCGSTLEYTQTHTYVAEHPSSHSRATGS